MSITLGTKVTDEVTGVTGTATARTTWVHGCVRILVEWADKDGVPKEMWFDEARVTDAIAQPEPIKQRPLTGGGPDHPSRSSAA